MDGADDDTKAEDAAETRRLASESPHAPLSQPGADVAHFRVQRRLGAGGMGEVYLARDLRLDRSVALKLVRPELVRSETVRQRFLFEARATAQFQHPNIVVLHDVGEHQCMPYLVLEYLDGETLRDRLQRGAMSSQQAVHVAASIAAALEHAHARGILHLDLKPANVFLTGDGGLRVLDFGLARGFGVCPKRARLGEAATFAGGTPPYMAPELWTSQPPGAETDVWALGVVLFEALSGRRPFEAEELTALGVAICTGAPAELPHGASPVVRDLVHRCLEKEPSKRPSASACAVELRRVLEGPRRAAVPTLAVLPFEARGFDDPTVGRVLAEELVDVLSRMRGWRVLAVAASERTSGWDPIDAARELGAHAVVTGTVQREPTDDRVRVTVRLLESPSGAQAFSDRFDGSFGHLFAVQNFLARRIAESLRTELTTTVFAADVSAEAMDLYLRARLKLRYDDMHGLGGTLALYERCLEVAPQFKPALAAHAIATMRAWFMPHDPSRALEPRARASVSRALAGAAELAETHLAAAQLHGRDGAHREAVEALATALTIAPTCAAAHQHLAMLECEAGRPDIGVRRARLAADLNPSLFICLFDVARYHAFRGRWHEADAAFGEARARVPSAHPAILLTGMRYAAWRGDLATIEGLRRSFVVPESYADAAWAAQLHGKLLAGEWQPSAALARFRETFGSDVDRRFVSFYAQLFTEACFFLGPPHHDLGARVFVDACNAWLIDTEWIDRCPVLEPLRSRPEFTPAREAVAERAAMLWTVPLPPSDDLLA